MRNICQEFFARAGGVLAAESIPSNPDLSGHFLKPLGKSFGSVHRACYGVVPVSQGKEAGKRPHRQQSDDCGNTMMVIVREGVVASQPVESSVLNDPPAPSNLPALA